MKALTINACKQISGGAGPIIPVMTPPSYNLGPLGSNGLPQGFGHIVPIPSHWSNPGNAAGSQ
jgi:hypothetical protein